MPLFRRYVTPICYVAVDGSVAAAMLPHTCCCFIIDFRCQEGAPHYDADIFHVAGGARRIMRTRDICCAMRERHTPARCHAAAYAAIAATLAYIVVTCAQRHGMLRYAADAAFSLLATPC